MTPLPSLYPRSDLFMQAEYLFPERIVDVLDEVVLLAKVSF